VAATLAISLAPSPAEAQYFGRNRVQYETFDFRIMETPHYGIYFYPVESLAVADAARMAERWYSRHSALLQHLPGKKPVILYADHPDFEQTNTLGGGFIDQSTGGVTEGGRDRVVLPFTGVYADNDHVLGHELAHSFQYDIEEKRMEAPAGGRGAGLNALPLWLIEGMAEYMSIGRNDPNTAMWLRDAARRNDLPTIKQLTQDPRYFPYRYGQALWAYIGGKWGDSTVGPFYRAALSYGFEGGIRRMLGISSDSLSKEWLAAIRAAYLPLMEGRTLPRQAGTTLLRTGQRGEFNLSPALSPDGKSVAFIRASFLGTFDLLVADAKTGHVTNKLTSPNNDSHIDAISYVQSAGSWSPDGRRLAFVVFAEGDNELAIFNLDRGGIERRIKVKGVGQISDPSWSPDGRQIVFAGSHGGIGDLYMLDMQSENATQLTNDRYAEVHPTWSPDGKTIAFATDRGPGTNFETLSHGNFRLALLDVATNQIRLLDGFEGAKHINPQYSPDGQSLFFVSDQDGFQDVYRMTLATGAISRVTHLATGVSGITYLSPAISVARTTGQLLFSVFDNQGYIVQSLDASQTAGDPIGPRVAGAEGIAGLLPPLDAIRTSIVTTMLSDPTSGLPPASTRYAIVPYKGALGLDYLGTPGVGVGVSTFGRAGFAGGVAAYFSDLLGNHTVGTTVQINGTVKDFGGEVFYLNSTHRWNWLAGLSHIPYYSGFAFYGDTTIGGIPGTTYTQLLQRIYVDQASGTIQYPFSQTRRIELGASYNYLHYGIESDQIIQLATGEVGEVRNDLPAPPGISYGQATAAFVGDYSYFGFTSPIAGGRYRFEVSPVLGGLNFQTLLGDYRRYFLARPITFAFRGMFYGRYGRDADSQQLTPLFLGEETLIRGYSYGSFNPAEECPATSGAAGTCPVFDRLLGDRIGVFNAELRIPLLGVREFGLINFPYFPTEIAPFVDAGVAWQKGDPTRFAFDRTATDRVPVVSTGVTARVNLFGYAVLEAYYAYPFQRPEKGAHWGIQLAPGW
jgi:hypothetical protein